MFNWITKTSANGNDFVIVQRSPYSWHASLTDTLTPWRYLKHFNAPAPAAGQQEVSQLGPDKSHIDSDTFKSFPDSENCFYCLTRPGDQHNAACPLNGGYFSSLLPSTAIAEIVDDDEMSTTGNQAGILSNAWKTLVWRHRIVAFCFLCDEHYEGTQMVVYANCGHTCCTFCLRKTMWYTENKDFRRRCAICRQSSMFILPLSCCEAEPGSNAGASTRDYIVEKLGNVVGLVANINGVVDWQADFEDSPEASGGGSDSSGVAAATTRWLKIWVSNMRILWLRP